MGKPGGCELVSLWPDAVHDALSRLFTAFATPYFVAYDEIGPPRYSQLYITERYSSYLLCLSQQFFSFLSLYFDSEALV